jgi:hypothetical protein
MDFRLWNGKLNPTLTVTRSVQSDRRYCQYSGDVKLQRGSKVLKS